MSDHGGVASETATDTQAPAGDGSADARPNRPPRLRATRDMIVTLALLCAGAFGLYLFIPHDASEDAAPPQTVEYRVAAATAARAAPYELLVPRGLGEEWSATSVRYEPLGQFGATWRLGFVTPDDEYAALAQADGDAKGFTAEITQQAEASGLFVRVGGERWEIYVGSKYDALVLREPGVTTIVFGTAPTDAPANSLARFAEALAPPR
jgi:hypothetical protein